VLGKQACAMHAARACVARCERAAQEPCEIRNVGPDKKGFGEGRNAGLAGMQLQQRKVNKMLLPCFGSLPAMNHLAGTRERGARNALQKQAQRRNASKIAIYAKNLGGKRLNAGERTLYTRLESLAGKRGAT
jgi:hypothetical protein